MQEFLRATRAGCVARAIVTMLFLSSLLLTLSAVESREIPPIWNSSYTQVHPQVSSNKTDASNSSAEPNDEYIYLESLRCDPSTDVFSTTDGIPSCLELDRLMSPESRMLQTFDQIHVTRPAVIPQCNYSDHIYDPAADACGKLYTRAHCGKNMLLYWSSHGLDGRLFGACTCMTSFDWELPLILIGDKCHKVSTQGPCHLGEVLIPVDMHTAKCGPDACLQARPEDITTSWKDSFVFTYRNECYRTETKAFCKPGQVVSFMSPYKIPFCVLDRPMVSIQEFVSSAVKLECGPGFVEHLNTCVPLRVIEVDFD